MKKYYHNILLGLCAVSALLFFAACEGDSENEQETDDTTYAVKFEVDTRATAAASRTKEEDQQAEKMKSVLIFIVNASGKIEATINEVFPVTDLRESYQQTVELTTGKKTIYGFANLTDDMRTTAGIGNLKKEDNFPVENIKTALCSTGSRESNYIPMSNMQEVTINKLPGQSYSIELIRLMCKITFTITNETGDEIELQQIETKPVTSMGTDVYLLPSDDGDIDLPAGTGTGTVTKEWPSPKKLAVGTTTAPFTIYLNESTVPNDGWFTFQLNTIKSFTTNSDRFSISGTRVLKRNDHLPVNILLTDYKLRLDVLSYPPIGGYPSVDVPMKDKEYYAHFPGGGPFIVTPNLTKYSTGEAVTEGVTWEMEVTGDKDIFDVQPVWKNNELIGTLKYGEQTGKKALCTLKATIEVTGIADRVLTYKVYIQNY